MVSLAVVATDRARIEVASVWQPYHFQVPTVAGCVGPVGVALAELVEDVEVERVVVEEELVLLLVEPPEQAAPPVNVPHVPASWLAALKESVKLFSPVPLDTSSRALLLWPPVTV
jgi:hypothetical protein